MFEIKRTPTRFDISNFPWTNDYPAKVESFAEISYDDNGFILHFKAFENNIRATETENNTHVYKDSCMEFFFQPMPETDNHYLNIEINPNGVAYVGYGMNKADGGPINTDDITMLSVKAEKADGMWELNYIVPVEFIKLYFPLYEHKIGNKIRANFYKCGDETDHPHYGCFNNIKFDVPNFHIPEFFADFILA